MDQKLNVKIPVTAVSDLAFGDLMIKKIVPQTTNIENIILESVDMNIKPSTVRLEGVKVGVSLEFYIYWEIGICIDYIIGSKCWSSNDTNSIGTLDLPEIGVPDMDINMDKIPFHLDQVALGQMNANILPIENFSLGKGQASKITLHDAEIPADWFTLEGMSVGGAKAKKIKVANMTSKRVDVGSVPDIHISIPSLELPEINISASAVGAESRAVSSSVRSRAYFNSPPFCLCFADFGYFYSYIIVKPIVRVNISKMRMNNVLFDAKVSKTIVRNVTVPMNLTGLQVQQLKINNISVPMISLDKVL